MSKDDFTAKEPNDGPVPLLIGLVGPSSSGKTYTALRLATGIVSVLGGNIHVIDTEAERARHYRKDFNFKHVNFTAPYGSLRYAEAIKSQVRQGAKVVIVDSMSHEHEGPGGYLETHEKELDRLAGDDWKKRNAVNFLAWAKPAAQRRELINTLTSLNAVMIFCFRAKEKIIVRKGQEPIDGGWMPIGGEEFVFEMTARMLLPPNSNGVPDWKPTRPGEIQVPKRPKQFMDVLRDGEQLSEKHGAAMARWALGDAPASASKPAPAPREQASAPPPPAPPAEPAQEGGPFDDQTVERPATLNLVGKDGKQFSFPPGKWETTLANVFLTKPFDFARQTWEDNRPYVEDAKEWYPEHAARVEEAWRKREAQTQSAEAK